MVDLESIKSDWVFTEASPLINTGGGKPPPFYTHTQFVACGNGLWQDSIPKINHAIIVGKNHMEHLLSHDKEQHSWYEIQIKKCGKTKGWEFFLGVNKGWDEMLPEDLEEESEIEYTHDFFTDDPLNYE